MATAINNRLRSLKEKMTRFSQKELSIRKDLHTIEGFPVDIWKNMGKEGLMGVAIPAAYGGLGEDYLAMAAAGEALVEKGYNLGFALSWIIHHLVSRFLILGFGSQDQKENLLPDMAAGRLTASIAVSEPETGAHPKHLKTTASPVVDGFLLNGEKAYLTNGPIADLFAVIAITDDNTARRGLTAFLLPRDTPGLTVEKPMSLDFLRPSPHCAIMMKDCVVPATAIIGKKNVAYTEIIKPFRELEDVMLMGPIVGGMTRQIEIVTDLFSNQKLAANHGPAEELGRFQTLIHSLRIIAYEAASMLDSPYQHPEFLSLLLSFRSIAGEAQQTLERFISEAGLNKDINLDLITRDIQQATTTCRKRSKNQAAKTRTGPSFKKGTA